MPYALRSDLEARFGAGEIGDLLESQTSDEGEQVAVMNSALADADAEIDARLSRAYDLPLPFQPGFPTLVRIAADLARRQLYTEKIPDAATLRVKQSLADLDAIVEGKIELVDAAGTVRERRATARIVARDQEFARSDPATGRLSGLDLY